jgi:hypothetical protein
MDNAYVQLGSCLQWCCWSSMRLIRPLQDLYLVVERSATRNVSCTSASTLHYWMTPSPDCSGESLIVRLLVCSTCRLVLIWKTAKQIAKSASGICTGLNITAATAVSRHAKPPCPKSSSRLQGAACMLAALS